MIDLDINRMYAYIHNDDGSITLFSPRSVPITLIEPDEIAAFQEDIAQQRGVSNINDTIKRHMKGVWGTV